MKGMYPLNKHCKATVVETNPTKFVWESQHVNTVGKATDQIRVELQASDKVQAASWANLVSRVNAVNYSIFNIYIHTKKYYVARLPPCRLCTCLQKLK